MTDLIGSDTGIFYELLAVNAYAKQFINELKPLSEKQSEAILKMKKLQKFSWNRMKISLN